ncbi:unnamed protein product [Cylindrotheca closterium]|uniref:Autophagy-related protein 9 n=1 Tax=Cylindrotheca closterium TaxID=2856 RepID=A0AAD2G844_9STRA|nr:unnamed protein product [Cylindrotheca closterium]
MYSNVRYQTLDDGNDEDGSADLWDQLDDVESREVRQHQSRFHAESPHSRTNAAVIFASMVNSSLQRIRTTAATAWGAAAEAWNNHPRHSSGNNNTDMDLDRQFGIQDLRPNSLEDENDEQRVESGNPFVMLSKFPLQAIASAGETHGLVSNLDVFLTHLYHYYYYRGLVPILCNFVVEASTLLFTLWLSRTLIRDVDWRRLATCKDETSCLANWPDYYRKEPLGWVHWFVAEGFSLLFFFYFVFFVWKFWQSLQQALVCRYIIHEKLGISRRKLRGGAVSWDTVVTKIMEAQESGVYQMSLAPLDPLCIAQRVMRKDNFLIAFWNQNILDTRIGNRQYWCSSLEWCIYTTVLNFMFNHKYEVRPAFYLDADALARRLKLCGIVHALFLPFLIMFVLFHFLLRNMYDFKTSRQYMGNKYWSTAAIWTFREFNELPHVLEQRIEPSCKAAEVYLDMFGQSEWKEAVGRIFIFVGGAVGSLLLLLGTISDSLLLHVALWGHNLLWYAGMAGIVYSIGKALVPTKEAQPSVSRNLFEDMDTALKNVSEYTHYYPENWKGRGWDSGVCTAFGNLFDSKVKLFVWELVSFSLAPYILYFKLSKCAPAICQFCLLTKARVPNTGDVVGYSTFDFENFKDQAWEGRTLGESSPQEGSESIAESVMRNGNVDNAVLQHPKPRSREGKMEKSLFSFRQAHPDWKGSPSSQSLIGAVEDYRKGALMRERDLYIEAATRQLDTLARLQSGKLKENGVDLYPNIDTSTPSSHYTHGPTLDNTGSSSLKIGFVAPATLPASNGSNNDQQCDKGLHHDLSHAGRVLSSSDPLKHCSDKQLSPGVSTELWNELNKSTPERGVFSAPVSSLRGEIDSQQRAQRQFYWLERFHEHLETQLQQEGIDERSKTSDN